MSSPEKVQVPGSVIDVLAADVLPGGKEVAALSETDVQAIHDAAVADVRTGNLRRYVTAAWLLAECDRLKATKEKGAVKEFRESEPFGLGKAMFFRYTQIARLLRSSELDRDGLVAVLEASPWDRLPRVLRGDGGASKRTINSVVKARTMLQRALATIRKVQDMEGLPEELDLILTNAESDLSEALEHVPTEEVAA